MYSSLVPHIWRHRLPVSFMGRYHLDDVTPRAKTHTMTTGIPDTMHMGETPIDMKFISTFATVNYKRVGRGVVMIMSDNIVYMTPEALQHMSNSVGGLEYMNETMYAIRAYDPTLQIAARLMGHMTYIETLPLKHLSDEQLDVNIMKYMADGSMPRTMCISCYKDLQEKPMRCSRCKSVYYCGPECQKTHWKRHCKVCKKD